MTSENDRNTWVLFHVMRLTRHSHFINYMPFLIFQILQESIRIPGSALHLMYQSSQAPGYLSRVLMRLTHATIPPTLTHVHVRVEIEGSVHTKTYEADPHLMHTFAWNKRNVYKQKVSFGT